jgi:polo-like kinase 1
MQIKIGDFGLAAKIQFKGERKKSVCGTPNYIAPEIIDGKKGHSYEIDVWSLGVIIYTLLYGKPPFEAEDVKGTYQRIKDNDYCFSDIIDISPLAKDLIRRILIPNPKYRYDIHDVENHPFLNGPGVIPRLLCHSLLNHPPSDSYI